MAGRRAGGVFAPDGPGALGLDEVLKQVAQDDQEEWEYEYSATETETYYLTVELSYPEFKMASAKAPHHSRGGYYKNWLDDDVSMADPITMVTKSKQGKGGGGLSDEDDEEEPGGDGNDEDDEDDDAPPLDPMLQAKAVESRDKAPDQGRNEAGAEKEQGDDDGEEESEAMEDIQILDLDSHKPIISYRGRVFEGQWAEVIGTEAILAQHDEDRPLPALRNLADGVAILGASSSRILTTEKVAKPRVADEDTLAPMREEWNIRIPTGPDRTGERGQQARFLENLIALKKKRGDTDQVTVYAQDGAGKDWSDRYSRPYKPRAKKDDEGDGGGGDGRRRRPGRRRGSGRRRGRPARRGRRGRGGDGGDGGGGGGGSHAAPSALSTPTPSRWDDLARPEDEYDGADDFGEDEDDFFYGEAAGDVSMTGYDG